MAGVVAPETELKASPQKVVVQAVATLVCDATPHGISMKSVRQAALTTAVAASADRANCMSVGSELGHTS